MRKTLDTLAPDSEYRRVYMKTLVSRIKQRYDVTPTEARRLAAFMADFFEHDMRRGATIDLGFAALQLSKTKERGIALNLPGRQSRIRLPSRKRYTVRIRKGWVKEAHPTWS